MKKLRYIYYSHKFFIQQSRTYMDGYSRFHYWTRFPRAYARFMLATIRDSRYANQSGIGLNVYPKD